ncbi:hypothetical protein [Methylotenera mobilis]|uniref:Uncharacterized protein n=1 Tax=Methylotenera mobilis (strain JLW8 / ATCC BAA-1282 / DSM 17540) TaxID=583345 RepID=C6WUX9_METML|nr:hypothetical protein [Methylotenera mobilis]ACT47728.1 hypothetical protein Mmol_0818 [Methylotenera mobilis JLW8]
MLIERNQHNEVVIEQAYALFLAETESLLDQAESLMQTCRCKDDIVELEAIVDVMRIMMEIAAMIYAADNALIDLSLTSKLSESVLSGVNINRKALGVEHIKKLKAIRHVLQADLNAHYRATRH